MRDNLSDSSVCEKFNVQLLKLDLSLSVLHNFLNF